MIGFLWSHTFLYAFIGGAIIAILCGVLSPFVVLKRMSFVGTGIAHSAFGGAGLALLLSLFMPVFEPLIARDAVIACFCILAALAIGMMSRRGRLSEDTAIGVALVSLMAVGVLLLDVRQHLQITYNFGVTYAPPLEALLFGQILSMGPADVSVAAALAMAVIVTVAITFKELTFFAFDEETARAFGVPTGAIYYIFLVLLALAIVAAMRSLGVILASTLLVLPGASARLLSDRIGTVTLLSAAIGVVGMIAGLLINLAIPFLSPGPVIAITYCLLLALCYVLSALRRA